MDTIIAFVTIAVVGHSLAGCVAEPMKPNCHLTCSTEEETHHDISTPVLDDKSGPEADVDNT